MFDFITLTLLWFFTAGVSFILWILKMWPGGIWWFWMWNSITAVVAIWELVIYLKYKMTLTRLITKADTDKPGVMKNKWLARAVVLCYLLGGISFCVHLWIFK